MRPPIIVYEKGAIYIFNSVKDAESYLEPIDVNNGEYIAYDSEGRLLSLKATSFRVTVEEAEQDPSHVKQLHAILYELLAYKGTSKDDLQESTLQELVEKASEYKTI